MKNNYLSQYICPDWPAPENIKAFSSTRKGGCSLPPFDNFNLAKHVKDDSIKVEKNRSILREDLKLPNEPFWLEQTHTTKIITPDGKSSSSIIYNADGSYSYKLGQVCVVMTADCLPILLTDKAGSWVAAIHAGWRGLANGIVQTTIKKYPNASNKLLAWLGPAISQQYFEVGSEVRDHFVSKDPTNQRYFVDKNNDKFNCNLYGIARSILSEYSVDCYGGEYCTYDEKNRFYSYRREGPTGRMASLIWIDSGIKN